MKTKTNNAKKSDSNEIAQYFYKKVEINIKVGYQVPHSNTQFISEARKPFAS